MVEDICEVEIIDAYEENMTQDEFISALDRSRPDVVGITVLMDQFAATGHLTAMLVKKYKPEIIVTMGGVYVTMNPQAAILDLNVDYLVLGEGEYVLRDMIGYFRGDNPLPEKGICYRINDTIVNRGRADLIVNLDALPRPAYHLIRFDRYSNSPPRKETIGSPRVFPYIRMLTSRGCPYNCSFCQVANITGRRFRPKSADAVIKEIIWLKEKYNIQSIIFEDDNFFLDKKRVFDILNGMIEHDLVMPWIGADVAVFCLDEGLLRVMRDSGCEYIGIALETGNERILKEIIRGKPINFDHARKMVSAAKKLGIYVAANFIIGFPTETWDEIRQTLRYAEDLDADYIRIFCAIPLRNTRLWDLCVEENAFIAEYDHFNLSSAWNTGLIETKDFSAHDLSILRAYEWDRINFSTPEKRLRTAEMLNITEEELLNIRRNTLCQAVHNISKCVKELPPR
jgi:radical SAM superfamily enzyme YgiQ (UPF0313 family)